MSITIEIPQSIEQHLQTEWGELPRRILEAIAVEGYRQDVLTHGQVGELLGFNFWETEAFLKAHEAPLNYSLEDLRRDRESSALPH